MPEPILPRATVRTTLAPARPRAPRASLLVALAALACSAAPAAAQEVTFTFEGRGFGHGVGMSQYGARGAAQQGLDATRILTHYYPGTQLVARPAATVRVLLDGGVASAGVGLTGPGALVDRGGGGRVALAAGTYSARVDGGRVVVTDATGRVVAGSAAGLRLVADDALVRRGMRRYRGVLDLLPSGGRLDIVNAVPSEAYLQGVLPGEMPASWGDDTPAALQAQAVAARTYALANLAPGRGYDVFDDTRSQVYIGVDAEDRRANAAIAATRRQVLVHDGRLITAYYSSTSGGHTESSANAFGGPSVPYLRGVPDPYDTVSPLHRWPRPPVFTAAQLGARLRVGAPVSDVVVLRRGVSPRVLRARIDTTDGRSVELSGTTIRARLGLLDTWFWVQRSDRPRVAEPRVSGGAGGTPVATPVAAPRPPRVAVAPGRGTWMVAAVRRYRAADARRARRSLARLRPRAVILRRPARTRTLHVVVTGRYATRADALRERALLRRRGYPAVVVRARAGDPAVRPAGVRAPARRPAPARRVPTPAAAPAPAPAPAARYLVVAAEAPHLVAAEDAARRLAAASRRPVIVSRWSPDAGTRYLVVTLQRVDVATAAREQTALRALGFDARVETVSAT
ncbi:MAG TPA: SpoIID/LytB domain-containing protein [Miltoncostaeaceae bacterium]|nr:SpoIID/LytB domain-containing protein [Miltoncostaeaceae bacterium]